MVLANVHVQPGWNHKREGVNVYRVRDVHTLPYVYRTARRAERRVSRGPRCGVKPTKSLTSTLQQVCSPRGNSPPTQLHTWSV